MLLVKDWLRFIFLFKTDQCFFIVIEIFGARKGRVNATLYSFFVFFIMLRRSSLLKTFAFSICSSCFVTSFNKLLKKILGIVFIVGLFKWKALFIFCHSIFRISLLILIRSSKAFEVSEELPVRIINISSI